MKLIVYTLTAEGEVPSYVRDGGYYAIENNNASPQDYDLIGLATNSAPEPAITDVRSHLVSIGAESWVDYKDELFDLDAAVAHLESLS